MTPLEPLLDALSQADGSDLHLAVGNPPVFRVHGALRHREEWSQPLDAVTVETAIREAVGDEAWKKAQREQELDAAFGRDDGTRFRINVYRQQDQFAAAIRRLPNRFFELRELGLDTRLLEDICAMQSGLILVTGSTSSGKSTTIASIIHRINETRACHIHTIEDPVEYRHTSRKAFVTQREVGRDTASFSEALRRSMRQDPDVVVIGEMRDLDTMSAALTLAETGHLTFATLHTADAVQTVSRVISSYPAAQQPQIRVQLASTLRVVISQKLVPWSGGGGRSLAAEILVVTPNVRAMIREENTHQIRTAIQTGGEHGMQTLNQSLAALLARRRIDRSTAATYSEDKTRLDEELDHNTGSMPQRKGTR